MSKADFVPNFVKDKEFTADRARLVAAEATGPTGSYKREETIKVLNEIRAAAEKGLSTITTVSSTDWVVMGRLKALGYVVKIVSDHRDGDYMTVAWG